ncbi:hypothetical protein [Nocardioides alcanivorans]|nr:hypothetical protein [Nocardioides alcanivorans]
MRFTRRLAALAIAVGIAVGAGAAPANADTSWGYIVKPAPTSSASH